MKPHRIAIASVTVALLAACASAPQSAQDATAQADVVAPPGATSVAAPVSADVAAAASVAPIAAATVDAPATAASAADGAVEPAAADAASDAVDDFAAIYGTPATGANGSTTTVGTYDPWQKYNRRMHKFNNGVDKYIAHPLAKAYVTVLPQAVRNRVGDFFDNLGSPVTMVNQLLQGHPGDAWATLGRFLMNSTIGLGGLFDPASHAGIPHRHDDFGQTLAVWGWRRSRYFELPFFGPRTLRDTFGLVGDIPLSPTHYIQNDDVRYGLYGLQLVDTRAQLLSMDSMREGAADDYALVRDAWTQHRDYQIRQDMHKKSATQQGDSSLPDYLREPQGEPDQREVPANAIPLPASPVPVIR